jgi:hypothetical protein
METWTPGSDERESDIPKVSGPFEGAFVIMNIGEDTELPPEYEEEIRNAYARYLSRGFLIVHAFDKGIEPVPWFFGSVDGHNLPCISSMIGMQVFDFPSSTEERTARISERHEEPWHPFA